MLRDLPRPRIWLELALIGLCYMVYSLIRNAVPEHAEAAQRHARSIWSLEQTLGIAVEQTINHRVNSVTWLIVGMNYYYATLHFVVTIAVLVWVYCYRVDAYRLVRSTLLFTTGIALVGYYFYPLAPPRLMTSGGFIDTVVVHGTWGSLASGDLANVSNQYAAMPSMHAGWSIWCACTIVALTTRTWVKVLAICYPVTTIMVIVATANHFWLDAVGGVVCLAAGYGCARLALSLVHRRASPVLASSFT